ncbi:periplasmic binding protein [Methanococcus vannielii SB]|uniref:Periplasmic binding protein n=1 Tax=Methanococcus vannielii (strain ATCC 35089 / DSM 1224 / JCM 13029 / OCM 148 / SB) TaxID=406327 RepID=A6UPI0_METVS|nr:iron ABC transporter substrate-binding protein [Methanococcus vannielii]ABR54402.1 periplasmic binding protein [Methanococcus vannielii SB]
MYKKGIFAVIISIMIAVSFSGCVDNNAGNSNDVSKTITIQDMAGRTVEIPENVEKIVCSGSGTLRLVTYIQALDMLAGVESCEHAEIKGSGKPYHIANIEYFKTLPVIGTQHVENLNHENVIKVNPDVIIISYSEASVADGIQEKTGIPVIIINYGEFESFCDKDLVGSLTLLGKVLNREKRAAEVIKFFSDSEKDIQNRVKGVSDSEKPTVYIGGLSARGAHGIHSTSSQYAPFEALKAKNVASSLELKKQIFVDKEKIIEWNPEIIFIDAGGYNLISEDYNKNPDYYNTLSAFTNGKIYTTYPYNYYTTNFGTALASTYYIGTVLYPEQFKDINPDEKADEIYEFLVGKPVYTVLSENYPGFQNVNFSKQ